MPRGGGGRSSSPSGGRSSGGSSGGFFSRGPARPAAAPARPAPQPVRQPAPVAQPQSGGMLSGMGGMVMTGMALGAGSEIGHQAVRAVGNAMSGGSSAPADHGQAQAPVQQQQYAQAPMEQAAYQEPPCFNFQSSFNQCLS